MLFNSVYIGQISRTMSLLFKNTKKTHYIYGFFSSMGWKLNELTESELITILDRIDNISSTIDSFLRDRELTQSELINLGRDLKLSFEDFSKKLITINNSNLSEKHIKEFTKDCAQYLLVLFLAKNYPLLLRLGELFGIVKYRTQPAIIINSGNDKIVLRRQVQVYHVEIEDFLALPFSLINQLIREFNLSESISFDSFFTILKEKIDQTINDIKLYYHDSLETGIDITLDSKGLHIEGDVFGFSKLDSPLALQLPPEEKILLALNGGKTELLWTGVINSVSHEVPAISEDGISFYLGGKDILKSNGAIHFHISEAKNYTELKGNINFELPADIISGTDGELISDGKFVFHYDIENEYYIQLSELRIEGNVQFGGSNGVRLFDSYLTVKDLVYPTSTNSMNLAVECRGVLSWDINNSPSSQIEVIGKYINGQFTLDTIGRVHLGNGIWLHPIDSNKPVIHTDINTSNNGNFEFNVDALFQIPHETQGTIDVEVSGNFVLENIDGNLHVHQLSVSNKNRNLTIELPGGITLNNANLEIIYKNNQFVSLLNGKLKLDDDSFFELNTALAFPDISRPDNINIYTHIGVQGINLFNQLYIHTGLLEVNVSTQPLSGKLSITEARTDFLPKAAISVNPHSSEFYLGINSLKGQFSYYDSQIELEITSGELVLPALFTNGSRRFSATIGNTPLSLNYNNQQLTFQFSIVIENVAVNFTDNGASEFSAILEHTTLNLNSNSPRGLIPRMTDTKGKITIPFDDKNSVDIAFDDIDWDIFGLPTGSIALAKDIVFPLGSEFELKVKGGINNGIKTGITISKDHIGIPKFVLNGSVELVVPVDVLTMEAGDQIVIGSSGHITWQTNELPIPVLDELSIGGSFRLGGSNGIKIQDGLLKATGVNNVLNPTQAKPFELLITGELYLGEDGPGAGIDGARFKFIGEDYPYFDFDGVSVKSGEIFNPVPQIPLKVQKAQITFVDNKPLPQKLAPTNIRVTLSAELEIPMPSSGNVTGVIDDISFRFNEFGVPIKKNGDIGIDIDGIGVGLTDFTAGTVVLTGFVYLSGLDKPEDLFFAGKLGGKVNGAGVNALLALSLDGPKGLCLELSGGAAGIPLGPTGFLLTGAEGGVVFPNLDGTVSNADPCDIRTYISLNDRGRPVRSNQQIDNRQEVPNDEKVIHPAPAKLEKTISINEFSCPEEDCPPPAISVISQPHPNRKKYPDRVIVKFTSIDTALLDQIGLTESFFASFGATDTPDQIANQTIKPLLDFLNENLPDIDNLPVFDSGIKDEIKRTIDALKVNIEQFLINTLTQSISAALSGNNSIYEAVVEVAEAGIPSPETTVKLTGSFSYAGVSTFLSITGGFSISTVMLPTPVPLISTMGGVGSIDVLGIPMGTANLFLNMTSPEGTPLLMPSICGDMYMSIGPVEFGQMRMKFAADGLLDGLANAGSIFVEHLSDALIIQLLNLVDTEIVKDDHYNPNKPFDLLINNPEEGINKITAVIGGLMNLPVDEDIRNCLIALMEDAWNSFNPKFELCGQVQPKLFGFGLGGEISGAMINIDKTSYKAKFNFSSSYIIGAVFGGIFPAFDKASIGMSFELPDPIEMYKKLLGTHNISPLDNAVYLQEGFEHVLENAVYTVEYELIPMGLKMADAEARLIMPDLLNHPAHPSSSWERPENRQNKKYLSRLELLTETLNDNLLADPLWKGTADELKQFDKTYGLDIKEYFPHGGMLGAARLSMPIALMDGIPPKLITGLFNKTNEQGKEISLIERFNNAKVLLDEYILKTKDIGRLGFYIPFPNPPTIAINGKTPIQLIQDMEESGFEWSDIEAGNLLSKEVAFFEGYINKAQILGIPVFNAKATAVGADDSNGVAGKMEIHATIPTDSWFNEFIEGAELNFTLTQPPTAPLDVYARETIKLFESSMPQNASYLGQVEIYSQPNYGGRKQSLDIGEYYTNDLTIGDNELSSVKIPDNSDLAVVLYTDDNFNGRKIVFTDNAKGLENNDDNIASSIRVVTKSQLAVEKLQSLFIGSLPKLKMEAIFQGIKIPDALSEFMEVEANTSLIAKAYSPAFDTKNNSNSLEAELQRSGGIFFEYKCNFKVGNIFKVDNVNSQLAVIPFANNTIFPKFLGRISANEIQLPFSQESLKKCLVYFNSMPSSDENIVAIEGMAPSVQLGMFTLVPSVRNNHELSISMSIGRNLTSYNLQLSPARIEKNSFISSDINLYGKTPNSPFLLKSNGLWNASASVGNIDLGINLQSQNNLVILRVSNDAKGSISANNGLSDVSIILKVTGGSVTAFPNDSALKRNLISTSSKLDLLINSDGGFRIKSEVPPFNFGLLSISGENGGNINVSLSNNGFSLNSPTVLSIQGLTRKPFILDKFNIENKGTFNVEASQGEIGISNFFDFSGDAFKVRRTTSTALSISRSKLILFPNTNMSQTLSMGNILIDSSGNFNLSSNNKVISIPNLFTAKGNFHFNKNGNKIHGKLENVSATLIPIGLSLSGKLVVKLGEISASLNSQAHSKDGIIELPSSSWSVSWLPQQENFSLTSTITSSLKIFNLPIIPTGEIVIGSDIHNHFYLNIESKQSIPIIPAIIKISPRSTNTPSRLVMKISSPTSPKYSLNVDAKLQALQNPLKQLFGIGNKWLINLDMDFDMSNGDFKKDITEHPNYRHYRLIDLPLFKIYSWGDCKIYFGREQGSYFIEFYRLRISIIDRHQSRTVSGRVKTDGTFNVSWDTPRDIKLGIFRLPNRKLKLTMRANATKPKFKLTIPPGKFIANGVPGLSQQDGATIDEIKIDTSDSFTGSLNDLQLFGWLDVISGLSNGFNNFIKFNSRERAIRIENKINLEFGPNSMLKLKIDSSGRVSGYIQGRFIFPTVTAFGFEFGRVDLGSIKLKFDGQNFLYTSQALQLNGDNTEMEDCDDYDLLCHARNLGREAVRVFSVSVIVKFGSSGLNYRIKEV